MCARRLKKEMTAHFQVRTFEVQTLLQVVYYDWRGRWRGFILLNNCNLKDFLWISSNIHILEKICFSKLYQIGQQILTKKDPTKFPCSFHFTYWNHQTLLIFRIHEPQNSFEFRTLHLIHKAFEFSISSYTSSAESERGSVFLIDKWDCILHLFHSILKIHDQIKQKQNKKII